MGSVADFSGEVERQVGKEGVGEGVMVMGHGMSRSTLKFAAGDKLGSGRSTAGAPRPEGVGAARLAFALVMGRRSVALM